MRRQSTSADSFAARSATAVNETAADTSQDATSQRSFARSASAISDGSIDTLQLPAPRTSRLGAKDRIARIYRKFNPEKLSQLPTMLARYKDREDILLRACIHKYGECDSDSGDTPHVSPQAEADTRRSDVEDTAKVARLRRALSVTLSPSSSADNAHFDTALRASRKTTEERIRRIYAKNAPSKLQFVDSALAENVGNETQLLKAVVRKYGEPLSDDDDCRDVGQAASSTFEQTRRSPDAFRSYSASYEREPSVQLQLASPSFAKNPPGERTLTTSDAAFLDPSTATVNSGSVGADLAGILPTGLSTPTAQRNRLLQCSLRVVAIVRTVELDNPNGSISTKASNWIKSTGETELHKSSIFGNGLSTTEAVKQTGAIWKERILLFESCFDGWTLTVLKPRIGKQPHVKAVLNLNNGSPALKNFRPDNGRRTFSLRFRTTIDTKTGGVSREVEVPLVASLQVNGSYLDFACRNLKTMTLTYEIVARILHSGARLKQLATLFVMPFSRDEEFTVVLPNLIMRARIAIEVASKEISLLFKGDAQQVGIGANVSTTPAAPQGKLRLYIALVPENAPPTLSMDKRSLGVWLVMSADAGSKTPTAYRLCMVSCAMRPATPEVTPSPALIDLQSRLAATVRFFLDCMSAVDSVEAHSSRDAVATASSVPSPFAIPGGSVATASSVSSLSVIAGNSVTSNPVTEKSTLEVQTKATEPPVSIVMQSAKISRETSPVLSEPVLVASRPAPSVSASPRQATALVAASTESRQIQPEPSPRTPPNRQVSSDNDAWLRQGAAILMATEVFARDQLVELATDAWRSLRLQLKHGVVITAKLCAAHQHVTTHSNQAISPAGWAPLSPVTVHQVLAKSQLSVVREVMMKRGISFPR